MDKVTVPVVVVEDDEDQYELIKTRLTSSKRQQFELIWYQSYAEAIKALEAGYSEVFLLAEAIGSETWLRYVEEARNHGTTASFIILADRWCDELHKKVLGRGACTYLVKDTLGILGLEQTIECGLRQSAHLRIARSEIEQAATFSQLRAPPSRQFGCNRRF